MIAAIAFLLISATQADDKVFYNNNGLMVLSGTDSCFLTAQYKNGIDTYILAKENEIYFILNKQNWKPVADKRYELKIDFGDEYYDLTTTATKDGRFLASLHPDFLDSYAVSGGLDISWGSNPIASLNLAGSSKAIAALRSCMKEKGIALAKPQPQPASPVAVKDDPFDRSAPASLSYYRGYDYPVEADGVEGAVKLALKVGVNGRAIDCSVLETSGSAVLDKTACKGLMRSRFNAAKDRAGQSIESVIERTVRFEDPSKTVLPD